MPAMEYPDGTPADQRWDWYFRVPDAWRVHTPDKIMRYATYLLDYYDLTHNGGPAELAATQFNDDWFFLVKSDVDPATVIDMDNLPPVPQSDAEIRRERLQLAATVLNGGGTLTAAQVQETLKHLINGYLSTTA